MVVRGDEVEGGGARLVKVGGVDTEMYRTGLCHAASINLTAFFAAAAVAARAPSGRGVAASGEGGPCQVRFHAEQRLRSSFRDRHRRMVSLRRAGRSLQGEE